MFIKRISLLSALLAFSGCESIQTQKNPTEITISEQDPHELLVGEIFAKTKLQARSGSHTSGEAWFAKNNDGIQVLVIARDLKPGLHGLHIHEKGDCSAEDASSAGPHYDPSYHQHGSPDPHMHHMGDLGNIVISSKGIGLLNLGIPARDHSAHENWQDIIGRSLVLHGGVDDLKSQPAGDSGNRIGCGVIEASTKKF